MALGLGLVMVAETWPSDETLAGSPRAMRQNIMPSPW